LYTEFPLIQQPFWNVEPISISLAPGPKLRREGMGLYRESQLPDLHFEFGSEDRGGWHGTAPAGIAALTRRIWLAHVPDVTPAELASCAMLVWGLGVVLRIRQTS
jgi:hypothetical protein